MHTIMHSGVTCGGGGGGLGAPPPPPPGSPKGRQKRGKKERKEKRGEEREKKKKGGQKREKIDREVYQHDERGAIQVSFSLTAGENIDFVTEYWIDNGISKLIFRAKYTFLQIHE